MEDVVENEVMKELIISNEDFEKYFNKKTWITRKEYEKFLQIKLDSSKTNNHKKIITFLSH